MKKRKTIKWFVCPYCCKVKYFGRFEHLALPVLYLLQTMAQNGLTTLRLEYEPCPECSTNKCSTEKLTR